MTDLSITAVSTYLESAGWSRTDRSWHGGAIWTNGAEEVLVPPRDGMGDSAARLRELLLALADAEERPLLEVTREIAYPLLDSAAYEGPVGPGPEGFIPLPSGLGALRGVHSMFTASARVVLSDSRFPADHAVSELLAGVQLGTTAGRQFALTLLVPLDEQQLSLGRRTLVQMHSSTLAVQEAAATGAFEDIAESGVTAEFCTALSSLAGDGLQQPFTLGFRWARGVPAPLPDQRLAFPTGAGEVIRDGAQRLDADRSQVAAAAPRPETGAVTIVGRIEALHDTPGSPDRWRIKLRGALVVDGRRTARRSLWIRLTGQEQYDEALAAHRQHREVRVDGTWTEAIRGPRIHADPDGLQLVEPLD
jgi:hypothetical protein